MNIVFFGTANVALPILEKLNKNHQVLAVVTKPDAPAGRSKQPQESPVSALAKDLKLALFKPENVKNNSEFLAQLQSLNADIFVVAAYGKILPENTISLPKYKTVNVHFSVLPKYRGPSPIQFALINGDSQTGSSIFILDEGMDSGPLLAQEIVNIEPGDNFFTLSDRLARVSASLLLETLDDYQSGKITPLPQDETQASFTKLITKEDGRINWQKSATEIYNQFRAFYIWPGIWTSFNGKILKIMDCVVKDRINESDPPRVDERQRVEAGEPTKNYECGAIIEGGKVICGGNTVLQIKTLKPEGKSETAIADFLNGYRDFIGSRLE